MLRPTLLLLALTALLAGCSPAATDDDDNGTGGSASSSTSTSSSTTTTTATTTSSGMAGMCEDHRECAENEFCIQNSCTLAWGRQLRIGPITADINGSDPSTGDAWDLAGGAPDPYAEVVEGFAGPAVHTTTIINNEFEPTWNSTVDVLLDEDGSPYQVNVFDQDDANEDDFICTSDLIFQSRLLELVRDPTLDGLLEVTSAGCRLTVKLTAQ